MNTRQDEPLGLEIVVGILVMTLGVYVYITSKGFPVLPGKDYGADLFPKILGVMLVGGGAIVFFTALKKMLRNKEFKLSRVKSVNKKNHFIWILVPLFFIFFYILLAEILGGIVTIFIMLFCMLLILRIRLFMAVSVSLVTSIVIWAFFVNILKVPLPMGFL